MRIVRVIAEYAASAINRPFDYLIDDETMMGTTDLQKAMIVTDEMFIQSFLGMFPSYVAKRIVRPNHTNPSVIVLAEAYWRQKNISFIQLPNHNPLF